MTAPQHEGLQRMQAEMVRQSADGIATLRDVQGPAHAAAESARRTGSIALIAMGGSHHVNTVVAPLYRRLGLDARAWTASELLSAPPPNGARTALIASQSGRSGEIVEYLGREPGAEERFALTLDSASPLARHCRDALVAHGGPEQAFAATRSITLTLAMHAVILEALGSHQDGVRAAFGAEAPDVSAHAARLADCAAVVFSGYGVLAGVATSSALSMMELARIATIGFEGGQFRHGPFEMLRPGLGVVVFRDAGPDGALAERLVQAPVEAGCRTIVVDASGTPPLAGCTTLPLTEAQGLAAAVAMLLAMQPLNIAVARARIADEIGTPLRTSKVTV